MKQRANVSQTFSKVPYCILFMIHKCKSFDGMKTPYMHYFDHGILYENAIMKRLAKQTTNQIDTKYTQTIQTIHTNM